MSSAVPAPGEQPTAVDMLYLDAEHFDLIARSSPPLSPGRRVVPVGEPFSGLVPSAGPVRPDEEPTS